MTSPLHHDNNEDLVVESYNTEEDAAFTAYMDIQLEEEEFIPFNDELSKKIKTEILKM